MTRSWNVSKVTPIQIVEAIEPLLDLWERRLGFRKVAAVPHGERLGFAILVHGASEVMLQTRSSLAADMPAAASLDPRSALYIEVDSLDGVLGSLEGVPILVGPRTTTYGMREVVIVDPSGHVVGFAEPVKEAAHAPA